MAATPRAINKTPELDGEKSRSKPARASIVLFRLSFANCYRVRCIRGNSNRTLTATPAAGPPVDDRCRRAVSIDRRPPTAAYCKKPRRAAPSVRVEAGAFKAFLRNEVGAARSGRRPVRARGVAVARRGMRPRGFNAPKASAGRPGVPSRGLCHHAVDSNSARASEQADSARGAEPEQARTGPAASHASTAATSPRARPQPRTYAGE